MSKELEIIRLRKELSDFSKRSFKRGLVSGTGGNISVRIPGTDLVLITPTGISLEDITPEINLLMNLDGTVLESPCGLKSSKETGFIWRLTGCAPTRGRWRTSIPPTRTAYSKRLPSPFPW